MNDINAIYAEWDFLNPNSQEYKIWCLSKKLINLLYIIFSKTFDSEHKIDTGLLLSKISGSSHLNNGHTLATFILSGKIPSCNDMLQICVRGAQMDVNDNFKMELLILS